MENGIKKTETEQQPSILSLLLEGALPSEIEDLSREVERLAGYRQTTIKEQKNG